MRAILNQNRVLFREIYNEGNYVGDLDEILAECRDVIINELLKGFEEDRVKRYTVGKDEECPIGFRRYTDGCDCCHRQKYCESYEKEES
jgi:hypothetical protein